MHEKIYCHGNSQCKCKKKQKKMSVLLNNEYTENAACKIKQHNEREV